MRKGAYAALAGRYAGSTHVAVMPFESAASRSGTLEPEALNGSNMMQLFVFANDRTRQVLLVARLDNLGKGASGQAVQNMNIMLGLPETTGL